MLLSIIMIEKCSNSTARTFKSSFLFRNNLYSNLNLNYLYPPWIHWSRKKNFKKEIQDYKYILQYYVRTGINDNPIISKSPMCIFSNSDHTTHSSTMRSGNDRGVKCYLNVVMDSFPKGESILQNCTQAMVKYQQ